ncbi:MAG: hypothetical protein ACR2NN_03915 [Bryobacteraceae bacterium]
MTHVLRLCWILPPLLCAVFAQDPKVAKDGVTVDPLDHKVILILFDSPYPASTDVNSAGSWVIVSQSPSGVKKYSVAGVDASALDPRSQVEKTIKLQLSDEVPPNTTLLDITLVNSRTVLHFAPVTDPNALGGTPKPGSVLSPARNKTDSDIYFNGSYTAVKAGDPVYDIDAFAGYMLAMQNSSRYFGKIGLYGQARTRMNSTADPNSFLAYLVYQRVIGNATRWWGPFQSPYLNFRFGGVEFDRKADEFNFVTSPVVTLPFRLSGKLSGPIEPGGTFPHMTLFFGTEFVNVRKSVLAPVDNWHTRGLLGATFAAGIAPGKNLLDSIQLTSAYQVRLPSAPEIFFDDKFAPIDPSTGKKGKTPPMLGTQARHSVDTKLTYNVSKWAGLTLEHTYGSLPPVFIKTEHSFTVGLSFTLKQTSYGRYSILKP